MKAANHYAAFLFLFWTVLFGSPAAWAITSNVGATAGSFAVSPTGSATYSIPIVVPPGVGGMEPNLALNYNSQAGDSLLGVGWNIIGLSKIYRCGATIDTDGYKGGVNLDSNDRYCLDGQRLVAVSGAYGANGTEYRTQRETFTKVVSYGTQGNGPAYFKAWGKDGNVFEFGVDFSSKIAASASATVVAWSVNKIQDLAGNYLTVSYNYQVTTSPVSVEFSPRLIEYTGNTAAGLVPSRAVSFRYESRPDRVEKYVGGLAVVSSDRMTHVVTRSNNGDVRDYQLTYEPDMGGAIPRSRLASVRECAADGVCLPSTQLGWQNGGNGLTRSTQRYPAGWDFGWSETGWEVINGDFNGDGMTDFARVGGTEARFLLSRIAGYFSAVVQNYPAGWDFGNPSSWKTITGDFNGDGKTDYARVGATYVHLFISNGDGSFSTPVYYYPNGWNFGTGDNWEVITGDFDGDGRTDFARLGIVYAHLFISNGDGSFSTPIHYYPTGWSFNTPAGPKWKSIVADFNGDGKSDYALLGATDARLFLSSGNGRVGTFTPLIQNYQSGLDFGWSNSYVTIAGDFNGDGIADYARLGGTSGYLFLGLGDGTFYSQPHAYPAGWNFSDQSAWKTISGDFNSDGKTDYMRLGGTFTHTFLGRGDGTFVTLAQAVEGSYSSSWRILAGDFNGDGKTDYARVGATYSDIYVGNSPAPNMLTSITTGVAAQVTNITYKPLTDYSVHGRSSHALQYPVLHLRAPIYVVASYQTSDGLGGLNTTNYSYFGAKMHMAGRGYLGFQAVTQHSPNGINTTTSYGQTTCEIGTPLAGSSDMRCVGLPLRVAVEKSENGSHLSGTNTYWATVGTYPYARVINQFKYELDGTLVASTSTTSNPPDANGNFTYARVVTSDNYITEITNTYLAADTTRWLLTRLSSSTVTRTLPTGEALTRKSAYQYNVNGLLAKEVVEPATVDASGNYTAGPYTLVTAYTYDLYGHRNKTTVSGTGITARSSMSDYLTSPGDAAPQIKNTNAKGHTETHTFDARYGVMTSLTGPNGRTTTWSFDGFGRKTQENRSDGTLTLTDHAWCPSAACPIGAPANTKYAVTATVANATSNLAPATVFYDMFGRELRRKTIGYGATADILQDTGYDALGRTVRITAPYFGGSMSPTTTVIPDLLGRPSTVTAANGLVTTYGYAGLTTTVTNTHSDIPGGTQQTTRVKNSQGWLTSVTNTLGQITRYTYDPFGNLRQTIDPNSNIVQMDYDVRGRKIAMTDPDMGYWTYNYNVLGELTSQTDAKNQVVTMVYDVLGRMTKRTEPEGVSTWVYDPATAKGELSSVSGPATTGPNSYKQTYTYDSLGRLTRISSAIAGTTYLMDTSYDAYSRVASVTYPAAYQTKRLTVYNSYDAQGYLRTVSNIPGSTPATWYWKANSMDALGHITSESLGNGLTTAREYYPDSGLPSRYTTSNNAQATLFTFDVLGNLSVRTEYYPGYYYEAYDYDDLNRLTSINYGPVNKTYTYDVLGNIKSKSDYGDDYRYAEPVAAPNDVPAGPHAVTSVYKAGALVASYRYDLNGNMTSGPGRSISYTSFNLPSQITQGAVTDSFVYDAGHQRILQKSNNGDTTVYLNPRWDTGIHFEKVIHLSAQAEYLHYIYAGGTPVAIYTVQGNGSSDIKYLHKDHLGSVVATTGANGAVIERMSYDAFGKRRLPSGVDGAVTVTSTHHGYTGHEHNDEVGLINMNGRFYDPMLGRFAAADPFVQSPGNLQSFNRYSYVGNNPLSRTDPSGYYFCTNFYGETAESCSSNGSGFGPNGASGNTYNNTQTNNGQNTSNGGSPGTASPGTGTLIIPIGNGTMKVDISNNGVPGAVYYQGTSQGYETVAGTITSAYVVMSSGVSLECNGCLYDANRQFWIDVSAYLQSEGNHFANLWDKSLQGDLAAAGQLAVEGGLLIYAPALSLGRKAGAEVVDALVANSAEKGGLNLFKWGKDSTTKADGWKEGDFMLNLPDKGSPKANWAQNSGRLREEMSKGNPIYDSYRNPATGERIPTEGFLRAERNLLESRGWQYNPSAGAYHPPGN